MFFFIIYSPGVLNGPDIRKLMKSVEFEKVLKPEDEAEAWKGIKGVIHGVLGKRCLSRAVILNIPSVVLVIKVLTSSTHRQTKPFSYKSNKL